MALDKPWFCPYLWSYEISCSISRAASFRVIRYHVSRVPPQGASTIYLALHPQEFPVGILHPTDKTFPWCHGACSLLGNLHMLCPANQFLEVAWCHSPSLEPSKKRDSFQAGQRWPLCPAIFFFFWGHKSSPSRSPELYILGVPCSHIRTCKEGEHLAVLDQAFHSIVPWLPRQFVLLASCLGMWVRLHQPLLLLSSQWDKFCPYLDPGTILAEMQR